MADEKDFYKDIIDNLYDAVYFVDRDRVITYIVPRDIQMPKLDKLTKPDA